MSARTIFAYAFAVALWLAVVAGLMLLAAR